MTEKEKALSSFERMMKREISKTEALLNTRIDKVMNAVDDGGIMYRSEREIQDAYGYGYITESERRRLLTALEYLEDRLRLKEDYQLLFFRRALEMAAEVRLQDLQADKARQRMNQIGAIRARGNSPRYCGCCGVVIGEVLGGNQVGTDWYDNRTECAQGHICKTCLEHCPGLESCKRNEDEA